MLPTSARPREERCRRICIAQEIFHPRVTDVLARMKTLAEVFKAAGGRILHAEAQSASPCPRGPHRRDGRGRRRRQEVPAAVEVACAVLARGTSHLLL